jgi:hypothetical protein
MISRNKSRLAVTVFHAATVFASRSIIDNESISLCAALSVDLSEILLEMLIPDNKNSIQLERQPNH